MSAPFSAADEHLMASLEPHPPSGGAPHSAARPRYSVQQTAAAAIANIVQSATPQKNDDPAASAAAGAAAAFVPLDLSPPAVATVPITDGLITTATSASIAASDPTTATPGPVPVPAVADSATAPPAPVAAEAAGAAAQSTSAAVAPIDSGELALMTDPTYAPYVAYFRRYDADGSNTISQAELAPLLREVGYCFSASVVRAVLAQYYPDATTALKFSDFLRLMQFSLTDLDAMLKAHLRPAVESGRFQTMHADTVLADLLTLIEYNAASAQYDFSASEARLQQLFQHDQEQVQLYMQQQQQQQQQQQGAQAGQQVTGSADAATAAPASAVAPTQPPAHRQASVATAVAIDPFALDAEDERFLRGAFDLCLAEFDADRDGAVDTRWSLGQCLRAAGLGLEVNERELADAIERIDRNKTGLADYTEFKQYYLHFWRGVLRRGVDATLLRRAFFAASASSSSASSSSMLELPTAQFLHTLRAFSGGRLSDAAVAAIGATADRNRDGAVDVDEFIELLAQTDATSILLRKSILRATALPVADYLAAFRRMPSTFRLSSLAALAARPERALSRHLVPRINHDGLSFFDYAVKASTAAPLVEATDAAHATGAEMLALAAAADAADALARTEAGNANSNAGGSGGSSAASNAAASALSSAHPRLRSLPALSTAAPALCVSLQLLKATGVPIPRDEAARAAIKQRVARVCLFEGNVPVSNVHVCECAWSPDREDEWVLDDEALAALQWNKVALRTKRKHALLCVELVAVVQPAVPMTPRQLVDERASMRANAVEIVCAIAAVEIPRDKWAAQMAVDGSDIELALPLVGGASIVSRTPLRADEVSARRPGFFASLFASSASPASQLLVRVQPPARLPTRFATFLQCAPADVLVALRTTRALRLYRELVADANLRAPFSSALTAPTADALLPVAVSSLSAPPPALASATTGAAGSGAHGLTLRPRAPHPFATALAVFARLVDAPELLHALDVLWEETRVLIDRSDRCDEKDGRASVAAKRAFARCVLNMLPAVQARSISGVVASSSSSAPSSSSSSSSDSSSSTSASGSSSWSFHAGVDTLPLAARVQRILHVVYLGRPALALNSDALTVEAAFASASGAGSVQAALGGAAAVGLFGKTPAEVTAATGGGAVPVALNSYYAPFHTQQLMWDPLAGLEF